MGCHLESLPDALILVNGPDRTQPQEVTNRTALGSARRSGVMGSARFRPPSFAIAKAAGFFSGSDAKSSCSSPVAMWATLMALPITSAGRLGRLAVGTCLVGRE